ncbi:hypothetical protein ACFLTH_17635, partial [Bacteroidota bacterium]
HKSVFKLKTMNRVIFRQTSGFREVSNEVRNLGERVQRSEPLNPCYNLPLGTRNSLQDGLAKPKFRRVKNQTVK